MPTEILEFGTPEPGADYRFRPGSYAVLRDDFGRVAIVVLPVGNFLPGGGQESGETSEETLHREVREECGFAIRVGPRIGVADELFFAPSSKTHFRKRGTFFTATPVPGPLTPTDPGHALRWCAPAEALLRLTHESHRWAVERALAQPTPATA